jgi:hypothetical protein
VKLSPSERKRSTVSIGATTTATAKLHDAVCDRASVAVQVTVVCPTGTSEPAAGVQATAIGALPPEATGAPYPRGTGWPVVVRMGDAGALHVSESDGAGAEGCVGVVGDESEPPQATPSVAQKSAMGRALRAQRRGISNCRISELQDFTNTVGHSTDRRSEDILKLLQF